MGRLDEVLLVLVEETPIQYYRDKLGISKEQIKSLFLEIVETENKNIYDNGETQDAVDGVIENLNKKIKEL